ncbi:hypothetical protein F1188_07735 [Roseospira marina]|uniref:Uncharacterized protein n=1 Tax=Roseospira marina TaxID=140057 RepID=A0A5M6IEY1_9PROT|nr:hypothetical protein [Roseospira marina]KAA5606299.1 hypothetical protein F1188_07735 [Roseospira marina]MBB4314460.1 hypothetical protein [Roseospira marina]MBB5087620.1 hypothetical protein [Roseospira marina]
MTPLLPPRILERLLVKRARAYLIEAHGIDAESAEALAAQAVRDVVQDSLPRQMDQVAPSVIRMARTLVMAPETGAVGVGIAAAPACAGTAAFADMIPAANRRSMRRQPLDPYSLTELRIHARRRGRRLAGRVPAPRSLAFGGAILAFSLLAMPRIVV